MICLQQNATTGALEVMNPQPSDITTCTLVSGTYSEFTAGSELFQLTPAQGADIGAGIALVFAIAFGYRVLARQITRESD